MGHDECSGYGMGHAWVTEDDDRGHCRKILSAHKMLSFSQVKAPV